MKQAVWLILPILAATLGGCATVKVKHELPPIYATVDVNIRIQEQLQQVFDYEEPRTKQVAHVSTPGGR